MIPNALEEFLVGASAKSSDNYWISGKKRKRKTQRKESIKSRAINVVKEVSI